MYLRVKSFSLSDFCQFGDSAMKCSFRYLVRFRAWGRFKPFPPNKDWMGQFICLFTQPLELCVLQHRCHYTISLHSRVTERWNLGEVGPGSILLAILLNNQQYCWQYCWISNIDDNVASNMASNICQQYCWLAIMSAILLENQQYCCFSNIADNIAGNIVDYSTTLLAKLLII